MVAPKLDPPPNNEVAGALTGPEVVAVDVGVAADCANPNGDCCVEAGVTALAVDLPNGLEVEEGVGVLPRPKPPKLRLGAGCTEVAVV